MKVVIIEGTDNVGKDTVIEELKNNYKSIIKHCEKPTAKTKAGQTLEQYNTFDNLTKDTIYTYKECKNAHDLLYIHNRSWYGEYVYGCMYRGNDEQTVVKDINSFENQLLLNIPSEDIVFITLLSSSVDFLIKNDDGLSISDAKYDLIEQETERFKEIFEKSIISNKHIVYVNNGDKFRSKEDIYDEILGHLN